VENETETRCAIEKLKVVDLKAELNGYGIENKALRNVRKAGARWTCVSACVRSRRARSAVNVQLKVSSTLLY
jgi:hypothetical protein